MMKAKILAASLSAALLAAPVAAQVAAPSGISQPAGDTPEVVKQKREAAARLLKLMRPVWTDAQIRRIMYIGWYNGAAAMCDDIEIDPAKLAKAPDAVEAEKTAGASPEKAHFLERTLMLHVGMATGWVMAGHLRDVPKLCAEARQSRAEMPAEKHLFEVAAGAAPRP